MERPKIFIAKNAGEKVKEYISKYCECEMWNKDSGIPRKKLFEVVKDVDGLIVPGDIKIDQELISLAPKLKVVSNTAVGYDNFDLDLMKEKSIIGTNTPNILNDSVADLTLTLMLAVARRVVELDQYVRAGKWHAGDEKALFGTDVHHKTLGIIGLGRIGEEVAKRARFGFGMEVLYYNRHRKPEAEEKLEIKYADFEALIKKSDFIVMLTPLTKETYRLIDHREFEMMKNTAIFINVSRGQTVNEQALIGALKSGKILGAGLDVYEHEPLKKDNPLIKLDNVVILPHIGSATEKTRLDMSLMAAENAVKAVLGEEVPNIVAELRK